jgi:hypothetical protein
MSHHKGNGNMIKLKTSGFDLGRDPRSFWLLAFLAGWHLIIVLLLILGIIKQSWFASISTGMIIFAAVGVGLAKQFKKVDGQGVGQPSSRSKGNSSEGNSKGREALMLYLDGDKIQARLWNMANRNSRLRAEGFANEEIGFGGWIPLRDPDQKIVGFKIVAWVSDNYLERYIFPADFIRLGRNVKVEKLGGNIYISIYLGNLLPIDEDWSRIRETTIYRNRRKDFVLRMNGFTSQEWALVR